MKPKIVAIALAVMLLCMTMVVGAGTVTYGPVTTVDSGEEHASGPGWFSISWFKTTTTVYGFYSGNLPPGRWFPTPS